MNLNIRNVDEELVRKLKMEALTQGTTLRAHCIALLRTGRSESAITSTPPVFATAGISAKPKRATPTQIAATIPGVNTASSLPVTDRYERPVHLPGCRCLMCQAQKSAAGNGA
jgi:hypothetical protein